MLQKLKVGVFQNKRNLRFFPEYWNEIQNED